MTMTPVAPQPAAPAASAVPPATAAPAGKGADAQVNPDASGTPAQGFAAALAALLTPVAAGTTAIDGVATAGTDKGAQNAGADPTSTTTSGATPADPTVLTLLATAQGLVPAAVPGPVSTSAVTSAPPANELAAPPITGAADASAAQAAAGQPTSAQPVAATTGSPATEAASVAPGRGAGAPPVPAVTAASPTTGRSTHRAQAATPNPVTSAAQSPVRAASSSADGDRPAPVTPASPVTPSQTGMSALAAPAPTAQTTSTTHAATQSPAASAVSGQVFPEVTRLASNGSGTHRISIVLNPAHLGEVTVTMVVRNGEVRVSLDAAGNREVQQALANGSTDLQRMLEHAGATDTHIVVGSSPSAQTALSSDSSGANSQNMTQTADHSGGSSGSSRQQSQAGPSDQPRDAEPPTSATPTLRRRTGQLDRTL